MSGLVRTNALDASDFLEFGKISENRSLCHAKEFGQFFGRNERVCGQIRFNASGDIPPFALRIYSDIRRRYLEELISILTIFNDLRSSIPEKILNGLKAFLWKRMMLVPLKTEGLKDFKPLFHLLGNPTREAEPFQIKRRRHTRRINSQIMKLVIRISRTIKC